MIVLFYCHLAIQENRAVLIITLLALIGLIMEVKDFFLKNGVYFSVDKSFINSLGDIEDIDYKYGVVDLGINSQEKLAAELLFFLSHTTEILTIFLLKFQKK